LTASSARGEGFGHTPTIPRGSATPASQLENDHLTSTFLFYLITWVHFFTGYWGQNELSFTYLGFFYFSKILFRIDYSVNPLNFESEKKIEAGSNYRA
jgi:hypothetical protein